MIFSRIELSSRGLRAGEAQRAIEGGHDWANIFAVAAGRHLGKATHKRVLGTVMRVLSRLARWGLARGSLARWGLARWGLARVRCSRLLGLRIHDENHLV